MTSADLLSNLPLLNVDNGLDLIYSTLDDLCRVGRFDEVDAFLAEPRVLDLPTDFILGYLTITRGYRRQLAQRTALMAGARRVFTERGEDVDDLLANLDTP